MAIRKKDIQLNKTELESLVNKIKLKFFAETNCKEQFTGSVKSSIYKLLKEHISSSVKDKRSISEPTLRNLMTLNHNGKFLNSTFNILKEYTSTTSDGEVVLQKIYWGVNYSTIAGAYINRIDGIFIPWDQLKIELEERVICRCPRIIPITSTVRLEDFYGRANWSIWIIDDKGNHIGSVWVGGDPENNWRSDGMIRVGKTISEGKWEVYLILARYSDGSYRMVESRV
jgi:hypothetical protein